MSMFGDTLKQLRKDRHLRQADIAQALGLTQATIANYEQGIRFPDETVLNQLADQLGVSIDLLLGRGNSVPTLMHQAQPMTNALRPPAELDQVITWLEGGSFHALHEWLEERLASGLSVAELYVKLLQPVMFEVGRRWEMGSLDVYQEHAISEQVKRHMALIQARQVRNEKGPRFLGFAVSGNQHELGIRMVADILQVDGWNCMYLGINLPSQSLLSAIRNWQPRLIGISVSLDDQLPVVQQTIYWLRAELSQRCPRIMIGGIALADKPELSSLLGADAIVADGLQALEIARSLVNS